MRVLVAEDDPALRAVIKRGLEEADYVVDAVGDGKEALGYLETYDYALAIVDWRMPKMSGLELVAELRRRHDPLPVLLLTARDLPADRIAGLDAGADDYLVKPFDFGELLARLRALRRRPAPVRSPQLSFGPLTLDPASGEATLEGRALVLTRTEHRILEVLLDRAPSPVTRSLIATHAWREEADAVGSNTIDVHIAHLRGKLGGSSLQIETLRGTGYRLSAGENP
jgi:DNA-binding response OmpR family regulator